MATASLRMRHVSGEINGQHSGVPIVMIHFLRWAIARHAVAIATLLLAFFNTASVPAQQPAVIDWKLESTAPWQPRDSQAEYVFADRLWIAGGWFDSFAAPPRDVWSSRDGVQWELVTPAAPWLHSDLPMNLTFDGRMWLLGGWYNGRLPGHSASNQVWSSSDGKQWEQATAAAPWSPRLAATAVEFRERMWLLGGTENYYFGDDASLKNDVWHSLDGRQWQRLETPTQWKARHEHSVFVFQDKLWIAGGHAQPLSSEVWSLSLPQNWEP